MPVVCFASPKGGVGRTTLAATIGVALHRLGWRVLALDLDRQNALRLNFELPEELPGIADALDSGREWNELAVETPAGIFLVPFGAVVGAGAMRVHAYVADNPGWLRQRLAPFTTQRDLVVVVDLPPGPSAFNIELDPLADLHVIVLLADAMSLALLPKLQHGDYLLSVEGERPPPVGYLLNQVDPRRQLCRDVLALSRDVLGDTLYGMVHQDEAVAEAAACQLTVLDYAPDSIASRDIAAAAARVHGSLAPV
jgi:cellulose synthase operon protein YhjQ